MDYSTLIVDRTSRDVLDKTPKGMYNYRDINRVASAVVELSDDIRELGYIANPTLKTDWAENDIPRFGEMMQHISDIRALDQIRYLGADIPLPTSPNKLTFVDANHIEQFLLALHEAVELIPQNYVYSGEIISGETR